MTSWEISLFEKLLHSVCGVCAFKSVYARVCTWAHLHVYAWTWGREGNTSHVTVLKVRGITWWSWFSPSTMWVPEIKLTRLIGQHLYLLSYLKVFLTNNIKKYIYMTPNNNRSWHIYMKIKLCSQWKDIINKSQTS